LIDLLLPQILRVRFYYSILSNLGGIPFEKIFFGKGLVMVVWVSGLFFKAYLVSRSGSFADFITHLTMLNFIQPLHKTLTMPWSLVGLL
jgi:hypothetical protein